MDNQNAVALLLVAGALVALFMLSNKGSVTSMPLYKNEETWELIRDSEGRVSKIIVHRDARRIS